LSDDALIYAAQGFTINGNPVLPVQRDASGNPIRDASGKLILVDKAIAVAAGYTLTNGPSNEYAGLIPPQVVAQQTVIVPAYADVKQLELNRRIPANTPTVTFDISQNPLNSSSDWTNKFPPAGTANNPTVVKVTGGGLNIPNNVNLSNYVITVEQGDINFNGNDFNFNNVALVTLNGNINLANVQAQDVSVFASSSINMNGGARFAGKSILATGSTSGNITFNGATASTNISDSLQVISQGNITYNAASNTRGLFLSVNNFTFNGSSTLYGSISAKGNIIFQDRATVVGVPDLSVSNINQAPSFTSTPVSQADSAKLYTYNIVTADPDAGDNLKITTDNLPSWLTLVDNLDGTATLRGTPIDFLDNINSNIHLKVTDASGLTAIQDFTITPNTSFTEGSNFTVFRSLPLTIPATPSILSFKIVPEFDTTNVNSINDAIDVALVDANGNSLVHTVGSGRDAFFNWTEGEPTVGATGTSYDAATGTVSLNLTGITPGINAQLVFRLVNDDGDVTSSVRITDFALTTAPDGTQAPVQIDFDKPISQTTVPNFNLLTDVSSSIGTEYHRTSFNADTHLLYADIALRNIGSYSVDSPLIVAVNHISDPTVLVRNPDGFTPDGLPYYDFSKLVGDTKFDPDELTLQRSLVFYNPQGVQFTYNLTVLSQLNAAPVILTQANKEIIAGRNYTYDVDATDLNGDSLTYKLLVAPNGMTIDQTTGLISWDTGTNDVSNQIILVEVEDGRGGGERQQYTLSVIDAPPNRPPIFISTPITSANINRNYTYQAIAQDPDFDPLTYSLVNAPVGMTIDETTGQISWTPITASLQAQLNNVSVTIHVVDGRGDVADQSFKINIQPEPGNHAPIIVSNPTTIAYTSKVYTYNVKALDPDNDSLTYSFVKAPNGMIINANTGQISWSNLTAANKGEYDVIVQVGDNKGGYDKQNFTLNLSDSIPATGVIRGSVFQDLDANGVRRGADFLKNIDRNIQFGSTYGKYYLAYDLGTIPGVPGYYGGINLKLGDPDTLLIGGYADNVGGTGGVYAASVTRDADGHITGFDKAATRIADAPGIDAGMVYTPDGVMLLTTWPNNQLLQLKPGSTSPDKVIALGNYNVASSSSGLAFVPSGFPGEGQLKLNSYSGSQFYTLNLSPDGLGTYSIDSVKLNTVLPGGVAGMDYIPLGSPEFDTPSLLVADYGEATVSAYEVDGQGNPIVSTRQLFMKNLVGANGAFIDPLTGDFLLATYRQTTSLKVVRGFAGSAPPELGLESWVVYLDQNDNGQRDLEEIFTLTDAYGNYSFKLDPGNYKVAEEFQPGWIQTLPSNQTYKVTLNSAQLVENLDFGNQNQPSLGTNNIAPVFSSKPPTSAITEQKFLYQATATDLNANLLTYDLVAKPDGMVVTKNGLVSWYPTLKQVGTYDVILRVQDSYGGIDLQVFQVQSTAGNTAPVFTTEPPITVHPVVSHPFQYQAKAVDAEGHSITYKLVNFTQASNNTFPQGAIIDPTTGLLTWTPSGSQVGQPYANTPWSVTIAASDVYGKETFQTFHFLDVLPAASNDPPAITSQPRKTIVLGQSYVQIVQASDPNYDPLTYSLETAPDGMTIDQQGRITWQPQSTQIGSNPVTIKVSDGRGGIITQALNIDVVSTTYRANNAPTITSTPNLVTNLERTYAYNLSGSDSDGDLLLWGLDSSPDGMVIDAQSGALRWQPQKDQIGEHTVAVRLTDAYGLDVAQEFSLTVTGVNTPSAIVSNPITRAAQNQLYTYTVIATDPENDPLSFSLGRKPAGMNIDGNGTIRWTPQANQIGSQQVEVFAHDAQGAITTQTYTIEVGATAINTAPSITSTPVYLAAVGSPYQYQVQANDPDAGDILTYQLLSVPAGITGITINPSTGLLTWNNPVAGNYKIVVGAVDAAGLGAAQGFTLTARVNNAPVIRSTPVLTATPGSTYSYDVIASDADGDRLSYTLDQVSRDLGMTLDALGRLRWTPTTGNVGSHTVVITVNDGNGSTGQQQYNLSVAADDVAPLVRLIANYDQVELGESVTFQARATDNIKVAGLQLLINGTAVVLDSNEPIPLIRFLLQSLN
jgi:aspartate 1-decarboxylase